MNKTKQLEIDIENIEDDINNKNNKLRNIQSNIYKEEEKNKKLHEEIHKAKEQKKYWMTTILKLSTSKTQAILNCTNGLYLLILK